MPTLTRSRIPAKVTEAQRSSSTQLKNALASIDQVDLLDGLRKLWPTESTKPGGHTLGFISLILETAQSARGLMTAREFAQTFLERPYDYSTTPTGISALMLEAWLSKSGQALFKRFVETVLDKPDAYLVVFEGQLSQQEFDRMVSQTDEFVSSFEVLVAAGQMNGENMISDLTILEAKPAKGLKKADAKKDQAKPARPAIIGAELAPESRQDYEQVIEEGGLSSSAMAVVLGTKVFDTVIHDDAGSRLHDVRGTLWSRPPGGDRWVPVLDERTEAQPKLAEAKGPPGLRRALRGSGQACETCAHYDFPTRKGESGVCQQFDVSTSLSQVCDVWDGNETGPDESTERPRLRLQIVSTKDREPVDDPVDETSPSFSWQDGVLRSLCGSWAVFEAPTLGGPSRTIVVAESGAWAVTEPLEEVKRCVEVLAEHHKGMTAWARDRAIERALAEVAATDGVPVSNLAECLAVARSDQVLIEERDVNLDEAFPPKKASGDKPPPEDAPTGPPAPPEPPEPSDRMDDPEFYRDDLQNFYDVQILAGVSPKRAELKTKQKFGVKELLVTPTGEVRSPGVTDRPKPPPPPILPPDGGGAPPAPFEQPDGKPDSGGPVPVTAGMQEAAAVVAAWAKRTGKSREEADRLWQKAGDLASKNYPDLVPESEDWYRVKMGIFRRMMGIAAEEALAEPQTIDDAFHRWVRYPDGDVEDFADWLADNHPKFLPHLATWVPADLHESIDAEASIKRAKGEKPRRERQPVDLTVEQSERYDKWRRLLNMTPREIRAMSSRVGEATTSLTVGGLRAFTLGNRSTRRLLTMKARPVEQWTEEDWNWAGRQVNTVMRLRAERGPLMRDGQPTEKLVLLRAWGHEPRVRSIVFEGDVLTAQRSNWRCKSCHAIVESSRVHYDAKSEAWVHACGRQLIVPDVDETARRQVNREVIDVTPGSLPCLLASADDGFAPSFADLKAGRVELSEDERTAVVRRKAVVKKAPAVWKSKVAETTWFVTNTHRSYSASRTLQGAINRFHAIVKNTA